MIPQPYDAEKIVYVPYENTEGGWVWSKQISLSHNQYFRQFWGTATFTSESLHTARCNSYTCSYLYSGNFIISTVKSRYLHCFNCLKLFNEDRQYPKNGRFWP